MGMSQKERYHQDEEFRQSMVQRRRDYVAANREEINRKKREDYAENKEKYREYRRRYVAKNRAQVNAKQREKHKQALLLARRRKVRVRRAVLLRLGTRCALCGWSVSEHGLVFHHRDPERKRGVIANLVNGAARMISWRRGVAKVLWEARKCEVLCGGCHTAWHSVHGKKAVWDLDLARSTVLGAREQQPSNEENSHV